MPSKTSKIPILLVDDYPPNLMALSAVLDDASYDLVEATSGRQALEIALHRDLGLILLDVQMPEMDGYEVARQVRAHPRTRDIPIIFLTAVNVEEEALLRGKLGNGEDFLTKPFDANVLRAKVALHADWFARAQRVR